MKIYNTLTRKLEEFASVDSKHVRMYTCGPTVYDYAHIGNYRAYVFEDLLRKYLKYIGYTVTQVMNLTDVDDKTIRGAGNAGITLGEYTEKYKKAFFGDLKTLNIEPAEHYPAATDHVPEMIEIIKKLFDRGYAYQSDDRSVYFSIAKFDGYGKLAHLDMSGLRSGARVAQDEYDKENAADFALWKAWSADDGDVAWDSPWGKGRPGWHIECSAMSTKYLGDTFDIHTGGVDNIFPHHEDEIAQSEGATGKQFVKYWMHCAHLVVDGRKMSKSLGNFYTLRDLLERGYNGREIRYVLIAAQYRQSLNFTFEALNAARASLARLDEFSERLRLQVAGCRNQESVDECSALELPEWCDKARMRFNEALDDDLNVSEALAAIFDMVHQGNKAMDLDGLTSGTASRVLELLSDFDRVLGVFEREHKEIDETILQLVDERNKARAAGNWDEADRIRGQILEMGWEIKDTPDGAKVRRK
ncbi:cysteine--tRNA ligase [Verrucomicrobiota bacterium]